MIILYHMGFYQPYFQESKVWIKFYQNPSFGDKILIIQSLKIPCDPYKIHTQSSFHTLACLILALPSSSLLLLFSFSFTFCSPPQNETNFGLFNPMFAKAMFSPPNKTYFWVKLRYLQKGPSMFDYLYFKFPKIVFWPIFSSIYDF